MAGKNLPPIDYDAGEGKEETAMDVFNLVLCIIGAVVVSSFVSRFIPRISTPLVQILLGAAVTQLPVFSSVELDPKLFMELFIAPLLYLEAREINKSELLSTLRISLSLAIGLALATMLAVGFALHMTWPLVPWAAAFALGAALGPTDAVAVTSLSGEASLTARQHSVLKGESLFNDASGIVGFQFSIAAAVTGTFSLVEATEEFALAFVGGVALGLIIGLITNWIFETMRSLGWETTTSRVLMELFLPFLIYIDAENIAHVSGILAVVAAGLVTRFDRTGIGPNVARTNIVATSVWKVLSFSLNGIVFVLLGMQLPRVATTSWGDPGVSNKLLMGIILLVSTAVIGMRFVWMSAALRLTRDEHTGKRRRMTRQRWASAAVMTFGGPKGAITLSLMLTIPYTLSSGEAFPLRDELIFIAAGTIIVTLLLANFLLPLLAPSTHADTKEINTITVTVLRRTIEELTSLATPDNRRAVLRVISSYTKRITRLKHLIGTTDPQSLELLQIEALHWEKDYLKERREQAKQLPDTTADKAMRIEACERMLDQLMDTLRHINAIRSYSRTVSQIRGRMRATQRRLTILARRVSARIRRTAPLMSEDQIFSYVRHLQIDTMEHVIVKLHEKMGRDTTSTEHCSALILDYRRAEASLRRRPDVGGGAAAIRQIEKVKHESYAIELGIIHDMLENGDITRAQAKELRKNVYVMQVDADSET